MFVGKYFLRPNAEIAVWIGLGRNQTSERGAFVPCEHSVYRPKV